MASASEPRKFFTPAPPRPPWNCFLKGPKGGRKMTTHGLKEWELKQCAVLCLDCYIIISA